MLSGLLMAHSGFVLAAALCYVLALQGLRLAAQPDLRVSGKRLASDVAVGVLIAGVVYGLFTQVLGIDLPAGWLAWN
ncbi:Tripartite tricarboxylate transporter TctB family protein [compost metagenome]